LEVDHKFPLINPLIIICIKKRNVTMHSRIVDKIEFHFWGGMTEEPLNSDYLSYKIRLISQIVD